MPRGQKPLYKLNRAECILDVLQPRHCVSSHSCSKLMKSVNNRSLLGAMLSFPEILYKLRETIWNLQGDERVRNVLLVYILSHSNVSFQPEQVIGKRDDAYFRFFKNIIFSWDLHENWQSGDNWTLFHDWVLLCAAFLVLPHKTIYLSYSISMGIYPDTMEVFRFLWPGRGCSINSGQGQTPPEQVNSLGR